MFFHLGKLRFWGELSFVSMFQNVELFHFGFFRFYTQCYLLQLFIHVQYVTYSTSSCNGFRLRAIGIVWFFISGGH